MPFPLLVGGRTVADPRALALLVQADCGLAPSVVPGKRPWAWILDLVAAGALEGRLAIGLSAALLQNEAAATIAEGARLAVGLREPLLGPILVRALQSHDTALLLQVDPGGAGSSVEDALLAAVEAVADLRDDAVRASFLEYLRHAGRPDLEVRVLARNGTAFELSTWLPAVLAEPLPDDALAPLRARAAGADEAARVLRELLPA
jgi:hypothetical protein